MNEGALALRLLLVVLKIIDLVSFLLHLAVLPVALCLSILSSVEFWIDLFISFELISENESWNETFAVASKLESVSTSAAAAVDVTVSDTAGIDGATVYCCCCGCCCCCCCGCCCGCCCCSLAGFVSSWAKVGAKLGLLRPPLSAFCRIDPADMAGLPRAFRAAARFWRAAELLLLLPPLLLLLLLQLLLLLLVLLLLLLLLVAATAATAAAALADSLASWIISAGFDWFWRLLILANCSNTSLRQ